MTGVPAGPAGALRRFAVVGSPIAHSLSPVLHRAAYAALGVHDARYTAHEVAAGGLAAFLHGGDGAGLQGLSVTMPLKREAFELASSHDGTSQRLGISNTLVRREDGSWHAENHDVHGIVRSLQDHGVDGAPARSAVLGSGATALSATEALLELGSREILVSARSTDRLRPLARLARERGAEVRVVEWDGAREALEVDVLVSALALPGARALVARLREDPSPTAPVTALDVLYDPWPAPLAQLLGSRGTEVASGLEMLVHQAARQVRSMLSVPEVPTEPMLAAGLRALSPQG